MKLCLPKNDEKIVYQEKKKTYTQKKLTIKEYKAAYYLKNIEKYTERNTRYRQKQNAIKAGTYIEPIKEEIKKEIKEEIIKEQKHIIVAFL
jgi:hypothetical protein